MKAFAVILNELNEGSIHAALTADLDELLRTVQATGRAGALTLKIKVVPAVKSDGGTVDRINVTADRKLELPKSVMPSDFFYLTDDGETTRNHPRQQSLELREVTTAKPLNFKEA